MPCSKYITKITNSQNYAALFFTEKARLLQELFFTEKARLLQEQYYTSFIPLREITNKLNFFTF